jgi:alpha-glucoside transport system substrate-binding protein
VNRRLLTAWVMVLALMAAACAQVPEGGGTTAAPPASQTTAAPSAAPEGPYEHLARAEAGEYAGTEVTILAQWIEAEGDNFANTLAGFAERTGIDIQYEGITDYETVLTVRVEGGDAPDLAQLAQSGLMRQFVENGDLVNLSDFLNVDQLNTDYSEAWTSLVTVEGDVYGVPFRANTKSIVWYPVQAFEEAGYQIPTTWEELLALSDQIVADGRGAPWCLSQEHGDATGWVTTDWIEDILLRTAPGEVYDQWAAHEIPFNAPEVLAAADMVGQVFFHPDYVFGGTTAINSVWVGDTQGPMFDEAGPSCWMHKQAAWIPDFWPKDPDTEEPLFTPGVDSAFFYFPPVEEEFGNPVLGAGDMFVMFNDRPEVRAVIEYLATADAVRGWAETGGFVSPNSSVPAEWYTSYQDAGQAEILAQATLLRLDASDSMPAEVGQGTFWSGMVDWVAANGENTEAIFQQIEESWPAS